MAVTMAITVANFINNINIDICINKIIYNDYGYKKGKDSDNDNHNNNNTTM